MVNIGNEWDVLLAEEFQKPYYLQLREFLKQEYSTGIMDYGDISLNGETFELKCENSVRLSVKEFELLQVLIMNSGRTLSAQYILDNIWDNSPEAVESTVMLYVQYLRDKLKAIASTVSIADNDQGYMIKEG